MTMIKEIATALAAEMERQRAEGEGTMKVTDEPFYSLDDAARAVLQAIREPSEGMQARGGRPPMPLVKLDSERARERLRAKAVWQAMIDAALAE